MPGLPGFQVFLQIPVPVRYAGTWESVRQYQMIHSRPRRRGEEAPRPYPGLALAPVIPFSRMAYFEFLDKQGKGLGKRIGSP